MIPKTGVYEQNYPEENYIRNRVFSDRTQGDTPDAVCRIVSPPRPALYDQKLQFYYFF